MPPFLALSGLAKYNFLHSPIYGNACIEICHASQALKMWHQRGIRGYCPRQISSCMNTSWDYLIKWVERWVFISNICSLFGCLGIHTSQAYFQYLYSFHRWSIINDIKIFFISMMPLISLYSWAHCIRWSSSLIFKIHAVICTYDMGSKKRHLQYKIACLEQERHYSIWKYLI